MSETNCRGWCRSFKVVNFNRWKDEEVRALPSGPTGQAVAAMIISKDLFLLGDQDYLRLPNKDEKRPQGPNMGRSNTAPNHSLLLFRYELTNCKLALEACHDNVLMTESKVSESAFKLS
ncbi:hypothetical protein GWI33_010461 [Rhynchophorus ferrugineus]|uniref:Uncharacterized protein n=1 Tax=Rhynchophorus ferrugineus TaxID=354439 RepID=A0A834IBP4_RHYFE|nr:hypothetical protein GWI33_010461 [Rhynchophorus ferrugineus]